MLASYANAERTTIRLLLDDGSALALMADDPRLDGMAIEPFPADPRPAILAAFAEREAEGLPVGGHMLQIDQVSQGRLTTAALMATLGAMPGGIAWRMRDNVDLHIAGSRIIPMALAAAAHWQALWTHRNALLDAAARGEAVAPDTGWPKPAEFAAD